MPVPFVGPSYTLDVRTADVQRSVGLYPAPNESGTAKSAYMLKSIPGLILFGDVGDVGRGAYEINGRSWVVVDDGLFELSAAGGALRRGTLQTAAGFVSIFSNTTQLYLVDGANLYALTLATNAFNRYGGTVFPGSDLTDYLDQYAIFAPNGDQKFYISALGDAETLDALDFASAESQPDNLIAFRVVNRELWLLGANGGEVWNNTGNSEFPIERNNGSIFSVGCSAKWTAVLFNNTLAWVGADKAGGDGVWVAEGYRARRISTRAVELAIQACTDLTKAIAYTQRIGGSTFYCLQLPGVLTTWCYDALTGAWHERAELVNGEYARHRVSWFFRCFGYDLGLGDDGKVYRWDKSTNTNAGDPLVRDRISPHNALPDNMRVGYADFALDLDTDVTGNVLMRYSDDGGRTWGDWDARAMGGPGNPMPKLARWLRCGSAFDRVWHVRCSDDMPFNLVNQTVRETQ